MYLVREKKTDKLYAMKGEFVSPGFAHLSSSRRLLIVIIFPPAGSTPHLPLWSTTRVSLPPYFGHIWINR